ncbi:MAG: ornithine carbamoyltransferase [Candidatus Cloacimonadota bacterium]|nr:MAG: ornithine carbamoyltransferase [Candidatus Cloacimonadota bacterium]
MQKDFVSIADLTTDEIDKVFNLTAHLKKEVKEGKEHHLLKNKTLAMIFEKPSLRTRVTFETGMVQLGGHAIYLSPTDIQLGKRESIPDVAKNLSRWVDCIMARTFAHNTVVELSENATVPVINALSDREHPCQILADFFTILEHKGKLNGLKIAYIGDSNNVCNSIILFSSIYGLNLKVASPKGYEPDPPILETADKIKNRTFELTVFNESVSAVDDADVIYTDIWASMGQEDEREKRVKTFKDFQVNDRLVSKAKKDVIVMHCLPAHRGEEITDEVIDGPHSVVLDEAENRLHTEKALLVKLLKK